MESELLGCLRLLAKSLIFWNWMQGQTTFVQEMSCSPWLDLTGVLTPCTICSTFSHVLLPLYCHLDLSINMINDLVCLIEAGPEFSFTRPFPFPFPPFSFSCSVFRWILFRRQWSTTPLESHWWRPNGQSFPVMSARSVSTLRWGIWYWTVWHACSLWWLTQMACVIEDMKSYIDFLDWVFYVIWVLCLCCWDTLHTLLSSPEIANGKSSLKYCIRIACQSERQTSQDPTSFSLRCRCSDHPQLLIHLWATHTHTGILHYSMDQHIYRISASCSHLTLSSLSATLSSPFSSRLCSCRSSSRSFSLRVSAFSTACTAGVSSATTSEEQQRKK